MVISCGLCGLLVLVITVGLLIFLVVDRVLRLPFLAKLDTRYILITGCDSGFGHEAAKRLDKMGCHVFAGCLTEKGETELQKTCSKRLIPIHLDVTDSHSIKQAFEAVKTSLPRDHGLWAVLNNAGITCSRAPMEWLQLADYQRVLDVNLLGMIDVTTTFLPLVKKACGRIVNTSSLAGRWCLSRLGPYSISKYGVEAFSDSLRRQMKPFQVTVHIIEPSGYKTNICNVDSVNQDLQQKWDALPTEMKTEFGEDYLQGCFEREALMVDSFDDNMSSVVDAYCHGVLGRYPRPRYTTDPSAYVFVKLIGEMAPEWFSDSLTTFRPFLNKGYGDLRQPAACLK